MILWPLRMAVRIFTAIAGLLLWALAGYGVLALAGAV